MNALEAKAILDANESLWMQWTWSNGTIVITGINHNAYKVTSIEELKQCLDHLTHLS